MLTIITLPSNFTTEILANTSALITDLAPYLTLIIGVILAVVVIEVIIGAIKK